MAKISDAEHPISLGSSIRFQVWRRRGLVRPAWAALCGALAAGGLSGSVQPWLHLALLAFLVDGIWGGLWSALIVTDWATPLRRWRDWQTGEPAHFLPYAAPDGPAGRLARTWGQLRCWWRETQILTLEPTLSGLLLLLPLALVIAGVLGARPFMATLMALALLQFSFLQTGGAPRAVPWMQALFEIALPWVAGHALFGPPTAPSLLLALAFSVTYAGGLRLAGGKSGLIHWNLGQMAAAVVLVLWHAPLAAGITGLLCIVGAIPQPGLLDPAAEEIETCATPRFLRLAQFWLLAAMLVAAGSVVATGG
jgi:hypothetical protein